MKKILLVIFFFTASSFFIIIPSKIFAASNGITCTPPATCYENLPGCPSNYSKGGLCIIGAGTQGAHGGICCTAPANEGGDGGAGIGPWGSPNSAIPLNKVSNLLGSDAPNNAPTTGFQKLLRLFVNLLFIISIIFSIIYFIWGGIDWIMSGGDKQKLQNAQHKIIFTIIGLVVVFLSFFMINIVKVFFLSS